MPWTGYLAPENFKTDLLLELQEHKDLQLRHTWDRLFVVEGPVRPLAFAQNTWLDLQRSSVASISDAARFLREQGPLWAPYSFHLHRRMSLIQEKLPKLKKTAQIFGKPPPSRPLGAWTLENESTMWWSSRTDSPYSLGEVAFVEDKTAPSRAYLKLWEFFTLAGRWPGPQDVCLDLGSSPGGWTWVLSQLGAKVISVDRAPLVPELEAHPRVRSLRKDAFALKPEEMGPVDWLFSDLICYPERLLELVQLWRKSGLVRNFVCTIKFQGGTDFRALRQFQNIAGSQVRHLSCNKHEVTWSLLDNSAQV